VGVTTEVQLHRGSLVHYDFGYGNQYQSKTHLFPEKMTNIDLSILPQWLLSRKSGQLGHAMDAFRRLRNGAAQMEQRMTSDVFNEKHSLLRAALLLLLSTFASSASAQVIPQLKSPPRISVFSTFTEVKPDYQYYGDFAVSGVTLGAYLQTRHVLGIEARASVMRWGGLEHEESALAGPRFSMHFGRVSPYLCILGGEANAWRWNNPRHTGQPEPKLDEALGPQWSTVGGLDIYLEHHFVIRMGELSYSKTYLNGWTMTPLTASAGIVYRSR
jgi:hypothetical protein